MPGRAAETSSRPVRHHARVPLEQGKEVKYHMKKSIIFAVVVAVMGLIGALRAGQSSKTAAASCCDGGACCDGGPCCVAK